MKIKRPSIKLYADPRHQKDDMLAIQIQISYGKRAYISTGMKFTQKQWEIVQNRNITQDKGNNLPTRKLSEIRAELEVYEKRANDVVKRFIDKNLPFTAQMIRDNFYEFTAKTLHKLSVYHLFMEVYELTLANGRAYKTAESYLNARSAFFKFKKYKVGMGKGRSLTDAEKELLEDDFNIIEINASFLREFESTMTSPPKESELRKLSHASVQSYIINLRAVFNYCINEGIIGDESYPFNAKNHNNYYKIRPAQRTKKAIFEEDIAALINIAPQLTTAQTRALDFFIFSILCNGANLVDIAKFENSNIDVELNTLSFIRQKTENNVDAREEIVVQLTDLHYEIIERNRSNNTDNEYIFNLLDKVRDKSSTEITRVVSNRLDNFTKAYKIISRKAGMNKFTYQYARHTFATLAVKNIGNIEEVGKSMGHASPKTTKNYIATLPVKEASELTKLKTAILGGYNANDGHEQ